MCQLEWLFYFRGKITLQHSCLLSDNSFPSPMLMDGAIPSPMVWTLPMGLFAARPFSELPAQLYEHFPHVGVGHNAVMGAGVVMAMSEVGLLSSQYCTSWGCSSWGEVFVRQTEVAKGRHFPCERSLWTRAALKTELKRKACRLFGYWQYFLVTSLVLVPLACHSKEFSLDSYLACFVSVF